MHDAKHVHTVSIFFNFLRFVVFKYGTVQRDGVTSGQWLFGHVVYSIVVYTVTLKVCHCCAAGTASSAKVSLPVVANPLLSLRLLALSPYLSFSLSLVLSFSLSLTHLCSLSLAIQAALVTNNWTIYNHIAIWSSMLVSEQELHRCYGC